MFVYREHLGSIGANFRVDLDNRINVTVSPLLAMSKHVVYTNVVEALLRFVLVNKGYMLLHSATVQLEDETIMLSAQTDTGKTGTILRLLQEHPGSSAFLSDDMTIVNGRGRRAVLPEAVDHQLAHAASGQHPVLSIPQRVAAGRAEPDSLQGRASVRTSAGAAQHPHHRHQRRDPDLGPTAEVHDSIGSSRRRRTKTPAVVGQIYIIGRGTAAKSRFLTTRPSRR